jgi:hypothetical protein
LGQAGCWAGPARGGKGGEGGEEWAAADLKEEGRSEPVRLFYFPIPFLFPRIQM